MPSDTTQTRPPAAPPPAGRPVALTREQVLVAALEIIDQDGVEALTMRRLGQALDRNPMGIYRHAADKDALLDGVVEHVLSALVVSREPGRDQESRHDVGDWETALRRTAHAFRRIALAHPNAVALLVTRSVTGPRVYYAAPYVIFRLRRSTGHCFLPSLIECWAAWQRPRTWCRKRS